MSQLATSVGRLESQGKLLRRIENNPKHNMSAISLRSEKSYEDPNKYKPEEEAEKENEEVLGKKEAQEMEKETPK